MGFSRQEYWSRLPYPSPRDLPDPGIEPTSLTSFALGSSPLVSPGKPIDGTFLSKLTEYISYSTTHETFSRTDHIQDHKTSFNNFKIEITLSIFSNYVVWNRNQTQEINEKNPNTWKLSHILPKIDWSTKKSKKKTKMTWNNENRHTTLQNLWDISKEVLRGKFTVQQAYFKNMKKISNLTFYP